MAWNFPHKKIFRIFYLFFFLFGTSVCIAETEQELLSFSLEGFGDDGLRGWRLEGERADIEETFINLTGINLAIFFDSDEDAAVITSEAMIWNKKQKKASTSNRVFITKGEIFATGIGAEIEPDLKKVTLLKRVALDIRDKAKITCDGPLGIDYIENKAVFNKNVNIKSAEVQVSAQEMVAFFDKSRGKIVRVEAFKDVRVIKEGLITYSESAVYDVVKDRVTFLDNPVVEYYGDMISD